MRAKLWPFSQKSDDGPPTSAALAALVARLHYEVVPMASIEQAIEDLPLGAHVSVTCSPAKGIGPTQEYTNRLTAAGFNTVPHLAARMVASPEHSKELAAWARGLGLRDVYVIAGDSPDPHGPYEGALPFLRDFMDADPGVERIGIAGYPDGHAFIPTDVLDEQLEQKQSLLTEYGVAGWISTQMCFDGDKVRTWVEAQRRRGIDLPIHLGIPGVVDRVRLMKMGTRLGVGASLRFLSKNTSTVMRLMAPGGYDPTDFVADLAEDSSALGIEALHGFTFNAVADTRAWQEAILDD
jgi:methylenetetrahydrofolate reductase (NADPH)